MNRLQTEGIGQFKNYGWNRIQIKYTKKVSTDEKELERERERQRHKISTKIGEETIDTEDTYKNSNFIGNIKWSKLTCLKI